ncbi:hypothetical protein [Campylobacter sp. MIT 97-5078]|uniref:hypothetical protein n=1 Tax=Campylobacter sp. MIT 97-5078 TaxID=1548153 RepID=UPI000512F565|nr:hypothetical protein [Campylobacter sp. MIT 97-5078]KGI56329.1 hypothetical protein LR59_07855 [Campylobacter sp. MIT 97-5078]KGI57542.1 hypothetical protein LR59_02290 [Campylobacter sp. MIT 97-5078]KGI57761.1 hypothetical protein LR59_03530 [Campylobacter sp. MIT 97-5078]TQR26935.1 hypothetical protein DMB91_06030 [Campylobacter sp. MIT 97-5078]
MQIQYSNFSSSISYDTPKNKTGEKNTLGLNSQNSTEEKDETKQNSESNSLNVKFEPSQKPLNESLNTNSQENKADGSNRTTSFNQNENTLATNYHSNDELDLKQKSSLDNVSETNLNQRANLAALAYQEQNKAQDQSSFSFVA